MRAHEFLFETNYNGPLDISNQPHREIDGENFDWEPTDLSPELVDQVKSRIKSYFRNGKMVLYRYIMINQPYRESILKRRDAIGIYWTYRPHLLNLEALSTWDDKGDLMLLTAEISLDYAALCVNWKTTIEMNIELPWESEITLKKGSPIMISACYALPDQTVESPRQSLDMSFSAKA